MSAPANEPPSVGDPAPEVVLEGTGGTFSLASLAGERAAVIYFVRAFT